MRLGGLLKGIPKRPIMLKRVSSNHRLDSLHLLLLFQRLLNKLLKLTTHRLLINLAAAMPTGRPTRPLGIIPLKRLENILLHRLHPLILNLIRRHLITLFVSPLGFVLGFVFVGSGVDGNYFTVEMLGFVVVVHEVVEVGVEGTGVGGGRRGGRRRGRAF